MHAKFTDESGAVEALEPHWQSSSYAHASELSALVLEPLPSGEHAWLQPEDDEPRYVVTDLGRRALAEAQLFGPWPTVAEAAGRTLVRGIQR